MLEESGMRRHEKTGTGRWEGMWQEEADHGRHENGSR